MNCRWENKGDGVAILPGRAAGGAGQSAAWLRLRPSRRGCDETMKQMVRLLAAGSLIWGAAEGCSGQGGSTTTSRQLREFSADDGGSGDFFGRSVAISGTTVIVGTSEQRIEGPELGSAYLIDLRIGRQIAKLSVGDGVVRDGLGYSVALDGSVAIVGSINLRLGIGFADLFDATTGQRIAELRPMNTTQGAEFGYAVAIRGTIALVGDPVGDAGNLSGSVYVFDVSDPQNPRQLARLRAADGPINDGFGTSIGTSAHRAVIGAAADDDNGDFSGSAYLFNISDPASATLIAKLLPPDGAENEFFGLSVAIDRDIAIVGAPGDGDRGVDSGAAYLFDATTGRPLHKLVAEDGGEHDFFGAAVAIDGDTIIVGARDDDENGESSGSAYLFDVITGRQIAKLLPQDGGRAHWFGWSVALRGDTAMIGAPKAANGQGVHAGAVYVFDATSR